MRIFKTTYPIRDDDGRPKIGPDGKPIRLPSKKWYVEFVDGDGVVRRRAGYTDKAATQQLAAELEREAARRRSGLTDRFGEHRKRPLVEHVDHWRQALLNKGATAEHAERSSRRVRRVFAACGAAFWTDLSGSGVQSAIADLRAGGASIATANHYVRVCKAFARWMVRDGRAPDSPLATLTTGNARTDRRHERRALSADELRRLIDAAKTGPVRFGVAGTDRAVLYRVAVETGLRSNEIRSLTVGSFTLDANPPTVTVHAAYSKHRREDVLPLRPELADAIREHVTGKLPAASAFMMPNESNVSRMMRADLSNAGIPYRDDAGRVADFHGLRHTFISNLARGGVHPKLAQALARHSTITLTMDRYSHTVLGDLSNALAVLPDVSTGPAEKTRQRATGTLGAASGAADATATDAGRATVKKLGGMLGGMLAGTAAVGCRPESARCADSDVTRARHAETAALEKPNKHGGLDAASRLVSAPDIDTRRPRDCNAVERGPVAQLVERGIVYPLPASQRTSVTPESTTNCEHTAESEASSSAECSAFPHVADADLRAVVAAWPDLPAAIRAGIAAMVRAAGCESDPPGRD